MQDGHAAGRALVQIVADEGFEQGHIHPTVVVGFADRGDEILDGFGCDAAPAQAAQGGEARVIPAAHHAILNQFAQFALAHHGIGQVQTGELDLAGLELAQLFQEPLIERAVDDVFTASRANG